MLKIKDNVDLKELEKFGFEFDRGTAYEIKKDGTYICVSECDLKELWFDIPDFVGYNKSIHKIGDVLFDLIQAGLVEKVSD